MAKIVKRQITIPANHGSVSQGPGSCRNRNHNLNKRWSDTVNTREPWFASIEGYGRHNHRASEPRVGGVFDYSKWTSCVRCSFSGAETPWRKVRGLERVVVLNPRHSVEIAATILTNLGRRNLRFEGLGVTRNHTIAQETVGGKLTVGV